MKVQIIGNFYNNHSLSIINRELAIGLKDFCDVQIMPLDSYDSQYKVDKQELKIISELQNKYEDPDIEIRHSYPPILRWPAHKKTKVIYIQHWEYSKVPLEWQLLWQNFADFVICSSTWTRDIILNAGMQPSRLIAINPGYDNKIFNTIGRKTDQDKFTFTYVGCGQYRKGIDILLDAWVSAFAKADNVKLYIKDTPGIYGENNILEEILKVQYKTKCGEIVYDDSQLSKEEMADLYKNTDVIVHPYRGEGFGMHVQEAIACGAIPLVTQGGSTDDIVQGFGIASHKKIVNLLDPNTFATKPGDSLTNMGQHSWMLEPDKTDLVYKMRMLYSFEDTNKIREEVFNNCSIKTWEDVIPVYKDILTLLNEVEVPKRY